MKMQIGEENSFFQLLKINVPGRIGRGGYGYQKGGYAQRFPKIIPPQSRSILQV